MNDISEKLAWMARGEVREGDQFQIPGSNPVHGWHLLSRSVNKDCFSNGSSGQTKQDLVVQHHQHCKQVQALQVSCHFHPPLKHGPCLLTLKRRIQAFKTKCMEKFVSPTWSTRLTTGCGARLTSLWVHRNLFWQLWRDGNLHGLGMSHAMTASPKPSFRAALRVR